MKTVRLASFLVKKSGVGGVVTRAFSTEAKAQAWQRELENEWPGQIDLTIKAVTVDSDDFVLSEYEKL